MARPGQMKADVQEDTIIFIKSAGKGIDAANVPANIEITGNCELQSCCYLSLWSLRCLCVTILIYPAISLVLVFVLSRLLEPMES